jgi:hypothetical protein
MIGVKSSRADVVLPAPVKTITNVAVGTISNRNTVEDFKE